MVSTGTPRGLGEGSPQGWTGEVHCFVLDKSSRNDKYLDDCTRMESHHCEGAQITMERC